MNYYKLIYDSQIIGAVTSDNFIRYQPVIECFLRGDETTGEYISYKGLLYRSPWMAPITKLEDYILVTILKITKEEYDIYVAALEQNEPILVQPEYTPLVDTTYVDNHEIISLDLVRNAKIKEMSTACHDTIENGFDLELREENHHFSLDTQDQLNLMSLSTMAQTQSLIPYHADGEEVVFYTAEEINEIVDTANAFRIYHTTYYNALKGYINALETIEEIAAIEYGTEIPEEYKTDVLKALEG